MSDTIFALASGAGICAISVIRVSGPQSDETLVGLSGGLPQPRRAVLRTIRDPNTGLALDRCLVLRFPGPASFTGEDGFELHVHGGRAVVSGVLSALAACPGLRLAEPGEFARRAFLNGKLDLTEVEGLADLIEANTSAQRDQAMVLAGGSLRAQAQIWRRALLSLQAMVEADIDFSDEGDVGPDVASGLLTEAARLSVQMGEALADGRRGELLRDGFTVVLAGAPNAGKSSLMNALVKRDVAIVSSIPGTTRDLIEATLDLDGLAVTFVDTAGLRETSDEIEREGVRRTIARVRTADLVLWLCEGPEDQPPDFPQTPVMRILSKSDLHGVESDPVRGHALSALSGAGVDDLVLLIGSHAKAALRPEEPALVSRERHRTGLRDACAALDRLGPGQPLEVAAEELRLAARALGSIIGFVGAEDVLGEIFSRFCIGK